MVHRSFSTHVRLLGLFQTRIWLFRSLAQIVLAPIAFTEFRISTAPGSFPKSPTQATQTDHRGPPTNQTAHKHVTKVIGTSHAVTRGIYLFTNLDGNVFVVLYLDHCIIRKDPTEHDKAPEAQEAQEAPEAPDAAQDAAETETAGQTWEQEQPKQDVPSKPAAPKRKPKPSRLRRRPEAPAPVEAPAEAPAPAEPEALANKRAAARPAHAKAAYDRLTTGASVLV